jgi:hypothetical protein
VVVREVVPVEEALVVDPLAGLPVVIREVVPVEEVSVVVDPMAGLPVVVPGAVVPLVAVPQATTRA